MRTDSKRPKPSIGIEQKHYVTPKGFNALQTELKQLLNDERPKVVAVVSWAAGNGDRSENGDYLYGKRRLREIDRRIRYLSKRTQHATIVDPALQQSHQRVFFGATVTYCQADNTEKTIHIVGLDEADIKQNKISYTSPVAKALLGAVLDDVVSVNTPEGLMELEVISIDYTHDE